MSDGVEPEAEPTPEAESGEGRAGRRTTVLIVAAAVVVLAAIGVGIYLVATSGGSDVAEEPPRPEITGATQPEPPSSAPPPAPSEPAPSTPASQAPPADKNVAAAKTAAEQAAAAINNRDIEAMKQLSCDPSTVGTAEEFPPRATVRLAQAPQITGDRATAQIELSIAGSEPTVVPLPLERRDGRWCVP